MSTTVTGKPLQSEDDVFINFDTTTATLNSISYGAGNQSAGTDSLGCGARFKSMAIPAGATITAAKFTVTSRVNFTVAGVNSRIEGETNVNPAVFSDYANYMARGRTTAFVDWDDIGAWVAEGEYDSPDLAAIIQEIIDLPGWNSGQDIVIFWDDHGTVVDASNRIRLGYSWDNDPAKDAVLSVTYEEGGAAGGGYGPAGLLISQGHI